MARQACISIDIDMMNYSEMTAVDELSSLVRVISNHVSRTFGVPISWFVRVDAQIANVYGTPDALIFGHRELLSHIADVGQELGWHAHCYADNGKSRFPESSPMRFIEQLNVSASIAREHGFSISRLGWGQHTTDSMNLLADLGFTIDSSAVPRPQYPWNLTPLRDWSRAPRVPYFPSQVDYQVPQETGTLLQVPITTVPLEFPTDTQAEVQRYVNLAYNPKVFKRALEATKTHLLVSVSHPYEFFQSGDVFSDGLRNLDTNLALLLESGWSLTTISEMGKFYGIKQ